MEIETWQIWTLFGGIPAVISGIIGAIWLLTSKKLIIRWTSKESEKLEEIKGSINRNNLIISNLVDTHSNAYLFAQEKRLNAIEKFWEIYLKAKQLFPSEVFLMYSLMPKEELKSLLNDYNPNRTLPPLIRQVDPDKFGNKLMEETSILDTYKIYIEPKLWAYFWIYRAFCSQLVYFVGKCKANGEIKHWTENKGLMQLLKTVMSEKEMKLIEDDHYINSLQYAFDLIEQKIINEITEVTTGKKQTISYLEQMIEFNKVIIKNKIGV
ncbi:hypothetical protein [uncultured Sunxiuqinia sp.]|uniref:hypothetical protein n=1 Tax=uncultured Sunxiuqinia sp. TaxID=1573825 RepID=UPI002AA7265B|nr:hypothetical protein [uncultured Sunxiuqinia sp.]